MNRRDRPVSVGVVELRPAGARSGAPRWRFAAPDGGRTAEGEGRTVALVDGVRTVRFEDPIRAPEHRLPRPGDSASWDGEPWGEVVSVRRGRGCVEVAVRESGSGPA